jgi:uncharacterized membrane protein YidH (DUF202 family)
VSSVSGSALPINAVLRTRLSWIRTSLAIIVTGFLLVRQGLTGAAPAALAILAGLVSVIVIFTALRRFKRLGRSNPPLLTDRIPAVITGGVVVLAAISCTQIILAI